jgi:ubiquinone/menaquinone biosynthesis C-methylase UbiE
MRVEEAYNHWSATYDSDQNRTRDLDQVVTRQTLTGMRCKSILEIGCGTGKNTALLAEIGESVCALDISGGMLKKAKDKLDSDNLIFSVADVTRQWPCADGSINLVVCNLVLEHIENLPFIFSEAVRCLVDGGRFFICELHPFRQYQGTKARFQRDQNKIEIQAFVHHISDFLAAAENNGLKLKKFREWWHQDDQGKPPRLVSFLFEKGKK